MDDIVSQESFGFLQGISAETSRGQGNCSRLSSGKEQNFRPLDII